ncbi:hypothetical protein E2C01_004160 [Portunus trituberculatus]|uniref:Uncharacterized protein n=1 Tax=Portunus trituberculatus TaxID=210409 RepID=A0A5B7CVL3_PORTR|nr:hypothetical protein [Portunus trituberculatus]
MAGRGAATVGDHNVSDILPGQTADRVRREGCYFTWSGGWSASSNGRREGQAHEGSSGAGILKRQRSSKCIVIGIDLRVVGAETMHVPAPLVDYLRTYAWYFRA